MSKVLVIGPGALGVGLAVRLGVSGHDVHVAVRDEAALQRMPKRLRHIGPEGKSEAHEVTLRHAPDGAEFDALILATKCDDAAQALEHWLPSLLPHAPAICLQNGLLGDALSAIAQDHLVECTVAYPATLLEPGISEQTGPGDLILGAWPDGRMDPATSVEEAGSLMADAMPTHIHENMQGVKWTKLLINSAITGLGVITGRALGELLQDRRARSAFLHIITEGYRVGIQHGIRFEPVGGLRPGTLAVGRATVFGLLWRHALLRFLGRKYRRQKSSSLQSLERGRKTEVPHLNGRIVLDAGAVPVPVNQAVASLAKQIEDGDLNPSPALLDRLPLHFH